MTSFRFAHGEGTETRRVVDECAAQLAPRGGSRGGLGFLYVGDPLARELPDMLKRLKDATGTSDWVGSVGAGICVTGREYFGKPAIAAMIADVEPEEYRVFGTIRDDLSGFRSRCSAWQQAAGSHFGVVHGDPRNGSIPEIIEGLADDIDGFLVGGLSSGRRQTYQIAGDVADGGLSGVLLSENVAVATALSQSCMLIGEKHRITRSDANVIIELDGRPALSVFKEDVGELLARDLKRIDGYIFAALPVRGSDTGDYMVRHIVGFDLSQELVGVSEIVETGQSIQFCRRDARAAEEDLVRMIGSLKRRANAAPRGAVYYSCVARGPHMFGAESNELRLIERELGDVPLVGLFCNGEISHNRLYGYTGVLTLFL